MSLESVRAFFAQHGVNAQILITTETTATVATAASAHGVSPGQIAKTLAFHLADGRDILVVAAGDVRIDHGKFKRTFGKGKMLPADEVVRLTGHPVGGASRSTTWPDSRKGSGLMCAVNLCPPRDALHNLG